MNRNSGMIAAVLAIITFLGFTNFSRSGSGSLAKTSSPETASKTPESNKPSSPCLEIVYRVRRLIDDHQAGSLSSWKLPDGCYQTGRQPEKSAIVKALPDVTFAIATLPNPVTTHLPLFFDRMVESIQQAAQDDFYSYDSSWFPWSAKASAYAPGSDPANADEPKKAHDGEPGVMVFRGSRSREPYGSGLVVFIVGEQPTGGINDEQFHNAVAWVDQLGGLRGGGLRVLGPTFSGSLPSLRRDLERERVTGGLVNIKFDISSGTVSAGRSYEDFKTWIVSLQNHSTVHTAMENDALMVDRLCQYLGRQGYHMNRLALLSEDETAFGARGEEPAKQRTRTPVSTVNDVCPAAIRLYYPRDIATLRSAYESQSILTPPKTQTDSGSPSSTLRGDLSEPDSDEHDTVRRFSGQLEPLAQEATLLDIANRLTEKQIHFIVLRATNSLDQIFLSQFLRRAYPSGRVIIDGADLLFSRGTDGRSLRGVMLLSTYPLLPAQQDWTSSFVHPGNTGYRTFGEDTAEASYIAARGLFGDEAKEVPIRDYGPPAWSVDVPHGAAGEVPPTWLTVVGHGQAWPLAVLSDAPSTDAKSILSTPAERGLDFKSVGDRNPLRLPISMWIALLLYVCWSLTHFLYCRFGTMRSTLRAHAYFAPLCRPQHPALIALGGTLLAMIPICMATASGLFQWRFHEHRTGIWLAIGLTVGFVASVSSCWYNFHLPVVRASGRTGDPSGPWRRWAAIGGIAALLLFASVQAILSAELSLENRIPAYWRSVHLFDGVSPLVPQLLLFTGCYLWFWCSLRGLAHFGDDRPRLPTLADLPKEEDGTPLLPMFSSENVADPLEKAAVPLGHRYRIRCLFLALAAVGIAAMALEGFSIRTLGELAFGRYIFFWICLNVAVMLADAIAMWETWSELRPLLHSLDRMPLRRTLRALKGLEWGSIWKMSGNVLEQRYRVLTYQLESLTHLKNATAAWKASEPGEILHKKEILAQYEDCQEKANLCRRWYIRLTDGQPIDLKPLAEFQTALATTAGMAMKCILLPAWRRETKSLIFGQAGDSADAPEGGGSDKKSAAAGELQPHVRAAEEFFVLPYLAFIQNVLGRIRTIALGSLWLFLATTVAVSSYPFDPLSVLGGVFLGVFVLFGCVSALIYAQMSRDATLSHITNTVPGALGWDFWGRIVTFGAGPLLGLLTTLFPGVSDFLFSWLQPGTQALK